MELGNKIRKLRRTQNISIEQLSEKTGLSTGLISQIERDITGPSLASMWKIAQALNVPLNYFFDEDNDKNPIVRKDSRKKIMLPNSNITYELLSPDLKDRKIECLLVEIQPGECSADEQIGHEGEECGYVIKGKLKVKWGTKEYLLDEGDSIYFDSTIPHRYVNIGDDVCISIWSMVPPSF
jgi:transcriptional regulator with XRE-family HTH domain